MAPFAPFEGAPVIALGVSGGPDSLALMHLGAAWARARGGTAVALTVDHGLRPEAAAEAEAVGASARRLGISHHILRWEGAKPAANLAAAARAARYALLEGHCRAAGILHLLVAHTRDDQAETVLLRLARGSGASGLAAMAPATPLADVRLLRPFLDVPKARLVATLSALGETWVEDPANSDPARARARTRAALDLLAPLGIEAARLAQTALVMGRARAALHHATARLLAEALVLSPAGAGLLAPEPILRAPREIGLRALSRTLAVLGGLDYPPRAGGLEHLLDALAAPGSWRGRTLGGCRLVAAGGKARGRILIHREWAALPGPVAIAADGHWRWDRFAVEVRGLRGAATLGPLGGDGLAILREAGQPLPRGMAAVVARSVPALRDGAGRLLAAPHLGLRGEGGLGVAAVFAPPTALMR